MGEEREEAGDRIGEAQRPGEQSWPRPIVTRQRSQTEPTLGPPVSLRSGARRIPCRRRCQLRDAGWRRKAAKPPRRTPCRCIDRRQRRSEAESEADQRHDRQDTDGPTRQTHLHLLGQAPGWLHLTICSRTLMGSDASDNPAARTRLAIDIIDLAWSICSVTKSLLTPATSEAYKRVGRCCPSVSGRWVRCRRS